MYYSVRLRNGVGLLRRLPKPPKMTLETEAFVMQASPEGESPDLSGVIALNGGDETLASAESEEESRADSSDAIDAPPPTSTLIEFPGVNRRAEPPWRKELSRRVREVQE